ncbi:MAG: hypothetical protein VKJ06_06710 [Vampirovibrionales bacterium]|nr:hypothetical protein [Vampirovibrionales bacterium]
MTPTPQKPVLKLLNAVTPLNHSPQGVHSNPLHGHGDHSNQGNAKATGGATGVSAIWITKQACQNLLGLPKQMQRSVYLALKQLRTEHDAKHVALKSPLSTVFVQHFTIFNLRVRAAYQHQPSRGDRFVVLALLFDEL